MKRRILTAFILAVAVCIFCLTAFAAPQKVKLSVEQKSCISFGDTTLKIGVTSSAALQQDLPFSYMVNGETFEGVMEAGAKKTYVSIQTPHVDAGAKTEFVLLASENYTLGNQKTAITLVPDLPFKMGNGGVTVTPAGDPVSVAFEVTNRKLLNVKLKMELRDSEGRVLDSKTFTKDYPRATFRFTVPKDWTGENPIALWYGEKKVTDDYLIIIRKNIPVIRGVYTDSKKAIITIDCGAGTINHQRRWMDLLDQYNAKATFFMTGNYLQRNPTAAAEAIERGHDVGNHTMTHLKLSDKKFDVVYQEIESVTRLISEQTGGYVPKYFRAPKGAWSYSLNTMVDHLGMVTVQWHASSGDSDEDATVKSIYRNVTGKHLTPGGIYLFHNATPGMSIMDDVFKHYVENGYEMVSLSMIMPEEYIIDGHGGVLAVSD